ncbi:hypothetical protein EVAR_48650_1 [Eumeta japonica]|uniref:Uncharacterized protein n=1 Tax=Eumeta variegata TaxID=151549 RepID=A0A4C1XQ44_EUMVA|nr:hypothetical protein EVAR_48650_1 [Eumeta japonica]
MNTDKLSSRFTALTGGDARGRRRRAASRLPSRRPLRAPLRIYKRRVLTSHTRRDLRAAIATPSSYLRPTPAHEALSADFTNIGVGLYVARDVPPRINVQLLNSLDNRHICYISGLILFAICTTLALTIGQKRTPFLKTGNVSMAPTELRVFKGGGGYLFSGDAHAGLLLKNPIIKRTIKDTQEKVE